MDDAKALALAHEAIKAVRWEKFNADRLRSLLAGLDDVQGAAERTGVEPGIVLRAARDHLRYRLGIAP